MRQMVALVLCVSLASSGCASLNASRNPLPASQTTAPGRVDRGVMADYVRQLPIGSRVRIDRANGGTLHAILLKRDSDPIVVQRRARIPEEPIEIPVSDILALELETGSSNPARNVAIGAAAAAGATLGVLLLLAAIFAD